MPEKQKKTIRELTLMLMYLTSWEERDTPEMRAVKKKELEKYPLVRRCWKGYDHDLLNKLSEEGLINAAGRTYPALITPEGEAEARKLLAQYGIDTPVRFPMWRNTPPGTLVIERCTLSSTSGCISQTETFISYTRWRIGRC